MSRRRQEPAFIYVADYEHPEAGVWIDAAQGLAGIEAELDALLAQHPSWERDELAIHKHHGFEGLEIDDDAEFEHVARAAELIQRWGPTAVAVIDHYGGLQDVAMAEAALTERYSGSYESLADWAVETLGELGELDAVPEGLREHVDFESWAEAAEARGDIFTIEAGERVLVFAGR